MVMRLTGGERRRVMLASSLEGQNRQAVQEAPEECRCRF
jgi:hypothetical protein